MIIEFETTGGTKYIEYNFSEDPTKYNINVKSSNDWIKATFDGGRVKIDVESNNSKLPRNGSVLVEIDGIECSNCVIEIRQGFGCVVNSTTYKYEDITIPCSGYNGKKDIAYTATTIYNNCSTDISTSFSSVTINVDCNSGSTKVIQEKPFKITQIGGNGDATCCGGCNDCNDYTVYGIWSKCVDGVKNRTNTAYTSSCVDGKCTHTPKEINESGSCDCIESETSYKYEDITIPCSGYDDDIDVKYTATTKYSNCSKTDESYGTKTFHIKVPCDSASTVDHEISTSYPFKITQLAGNGNSLCCDQIPQCGFRGTDNGITRCPSGDDVWPLVACSTATSDGDTIITEHVYDSNGCRLTNGWSGMTVPWENSVIPNQYVKFTFDQEHGYCDWGMIRLKFDAYDTSEATTYRSATIILRTTDETIPEICNGIKPPHAKGELTKEWEFTIWQAPKGYYWCKGVVPHVLTPCSGSCVSDAKTCDCVECKEDEVTYEYEYVEKNISCEGFSGKISIPYTVTTTYVKGHEVCEDKTTIVKSTSSVTVNIGCYNGTDRHVAYEIPGILTVIQSGCNINSCGGVTCNKDNIAINWEENITIPCEYNETKICSYYLNGCNDNLGISANTNEVSFKKEGGIIYCITNKRTYDSNLTIKVQLYYDGDKIGDEKTIIKKGGCPSCPSISNFGLILEINKYHKLYYHNGDDGFTEITSKYNYNEKDNKVGIIETKIQVPLGYTLDSSYSCSAWLDYNFVETDNEGIYDFEFEILDDTNDDRECTITYKIHETNNKKNSCGKRTITVTQKRTIGCPTLNDVDITIPYREWYDCVIVGDTIVIPKNYILAITNNKYPWLTVYTDNVYSDGNYNYYIIKADIEQNSTMSSRTAKFQYDVYTDNGVLCNGWKNLTITQTK